MQILSWKFKYLELVEAYALVLLTFSSQRTAGS